MLNLFTRRLVVAAFAAVVLWLSPGLTTKAEAAVAPISLRASLDASHLDGLKQLVQFNGCGGGFCTPAPVSSGGGGITFTATDAQLKNPGFSAGSFTANIGTASADRIVVFGIVGNWTSGGSGAAPTVNSSAATLAAGNCVTNNAVCLYYANVTTGTTATIGFASGASSVSLVVATLHGQSGGGSAAATNPVTYTAAGAQPLSVTLAGTVGGIGIVIGGGPFGTGPGTFTWTNTVVGAGDENEGDANSILSMAHATSTGATTVSNTSSLSFGGTMAGAWWAP